MWVFLSARGGFFFIEREEVRRYHRLPYRRLVGGDLFGHSTPQHRTIVISLEHCFDKAGRDKDLV